MPRGAYYQAAYHWPHMFLTLCPTFLGIGRAAFDFTVGYLRGEVPGAPPPGGIRMIEARSGQLLGRADAHRHLPMGIG